MDRIWLKHYPAGVPADIDTAQYPSLVALLEESFIGLVLCESIGISNKVIIAGR